MIQPEQVVEEARKWLGVPWKHQGRDRSGLDCGGLIVVIARAFEISDYDIRGYRRNPPGLLDFLKHFDENMTRVSNVHRAGLVAIFRHSRTVIHCGVFSEKRGVPHVVEARAESRKVVETPFDRNQRALWVATYAYPGTESWAS